MAFKNNRLVTRKPKNDKEIRDKISSTINRLGSEKDKEYFSQMLFDLVKNNSVPLEVFDSLPINSAKSGKTRFDQIYDASMFLATPNYRKETLEALIGEIKDGEEEQIKIWRVVFPAKLQIPSVIIRAKSFQDAFALGCDYGCRVSLRQERKIPIDMTMRVLFMGEKSVRRHLSLRWANRVQKRKQLQLEGREFTFKQVTGARLAALEHKDHPNRSISYYAELKDLARVRTKAGLIRLSSIEHEYKSDATIVDEETE
jgi:hypothetical protein